MFKKLKFYIFLFISVHCIAQNKEYSEEHLHEKLTWIKNNFSNESSYKDSLQIFIKKAKSFIKPDYTMAGYEFQYLLEKDPKVRLAYLDSSYQIAVEQKQPSYQAHYKLKIAQEYFDQQDYQNTLQHSLELQDYQSDEIAYHKNASKFLIALMEFKIENYRKSLKGYHQIKSYFYKESKEHYLNILFGIAEDHLALKNIDSAAYYIELGHKNPTGEYSDYSC